MGMGDLARLDDLGDDLPDVGAPLIGDGGVFSAGKRWANDIADNLPGAIAGGIAQQVMTPGLLAQPNPYPEGSEAADWFEGRRHAGMMKAAPEMALNVMGGGAGGTGERAGVALGSGPIKKAPALPMDEASRLARAAEQKYTIDAYHGTRSPNEISQFETGHIYNDEGDLVHAYSGDPNSLIGPHAAAEPAVADKFAGGEGVDWLKNRQTEGNPAVYPLKLDATKVQKFKREEDLNTLLFRQDVGHMDEVDNILMGHGDDAGTRYVRDKNYREQVNREAVRNENNYDDPSSEVGHALADAVRRQYEKAGVTTIQYPNAVEGGTSYIAVAPPRSRFAAFDPANKDSGFLLGSGATDQKAAAAIQGIRAYHSSPYDFDKFDLSKIGTGEGAQVYGHGLYFAENPAVSGQGGQYWNQFMRKFEGPEYLAADKLKKSGFDRDVATASSQWEVRKLEDALKRGAHPPGLEGGPFDEHTLRSITKNMLYDKQTELDLLRSGQPVGPRTYEVNINADPAHMLDWDKRLAEQSPVVQDALGQLGVTSKLDKMTPRGDALYRRLAIPGGRNTSLSQGTVQASAALQEAGIPGIKYLDQGSRNPGFSSLTPTQLNARISTLQQDIAGGKGNTPLLQSRLDDLLREQASYKNQTSNYVVFDPAKIDIRKKYGIAGAAGAGGMGALAAQDDYQWH